MSRRKSQAEKRIECMCAQLRFSPTVVEWKAKKILTQYRDSQHLRNCARDDESVLDKAAVLIREKYNKCYKDRKCHETGSLDYMVAEILATSSTDKIIDVVFERMGEFQFNAEEYKRMIYLCYFEPLKPVDEEIMDELSLGRSSFYRKKKEATILFGIILWTVMLEEFDLVQTVVAM